MRRKQYIRGRKLYENSVGEDEGDGVRNSLAGKKARGCTFFFRWFVRSSFMIEWTLFSRDISPCLR